MNESTRRQIVALAKQIKASRDPEEQRELRRRLLELVARKPR